MQVAFGSEYFLIKEGMNSMIIFSTSVIVLYIVECTWVGYGYVSWSHMVIVWVYREDRITIGILWREDSNFLFNLS